MQENTRRFWDSVYNNWVSTGRKVFWSIQWNFNQNEERLLFGANNMIYDYWYRMQFGAYLKVGLYSLKDKNEKKQKQKQNKKVNNI